MRILVLFVAILVLQPRPGLSQSGTSGQTYYPGQLLVASPKMHDPRFARTVIFLCRHDSTGAFGLILNRPVDQQPARKLLNSLGIDPAKVKGELQIRLGGPVELNSAFLMHSEIFGGKTQICKRHGIAVTSNKKVLEALKEDTGPKRSVLYFGYTGWGPGQLDGELKRQDWVVSPADQQMLFDKNAVGMWRRAPDRRGIDL